MQHSETILRAAINQDDRFVATASQDNTARLWDTGTGEPMHLPVRTSGGATAVAFHPGGASLLVGAGDGSLQLFDLPPTQAPPPWLADLADFAATQNRYNQVEQPNLDKIRALRAQLLASRNTDGWTRFGQWYFAESAVRPISPWSIVPLRQFVDALIRRGDRTSLEYAKSLSYDQPTWMVRIVPLLAAPPPAGSSTAETVLQNATDSGTATASGRTR